MRTFFDRSALGLGVALLLLAACGSDPKPPTETNRPNDDSSSSDTESTETTGSNEESSAPAPSPSGPSPGEPVLEDVPPETELSDLDDDQLQEVCTAYVATANAVSETMGELCPAQAVFLAVQASTEETSDADFQRSCTDGLSSCEAQLTEAQSSTPQERCETAADCSASIKDFNDCNLQIAALNESVLVPLSEQTIPECSDLTLARADTLSGTLAIQLIFGLGAVTTETGGNPTDEDGPCQRINDACPELGVSLGAFSDLSGMLP